VRQRLAVLCTERTAKIHPPETFGRRSGNGCNGHYLPLPSIEASGRYGFRIAIQHGLNDRDARRP